MSYSEIQSEEFFYFSEKEKDAIENFLKRKGYSIHTNSVCGSCCGMYADYYYVNGVGGKWKSKKDAIDFGEFCKKNKIECSYSLDSYTISADPNEKDIKINLNQ